MTALIATVTPDAGYLSQDTLVCMEKGSASAKNFGVTDSHEEAARSAFVGDGTPPKVEALGFISKIRVLPHIHVVVGMSGGLDMAAAWSMNFLHALNLGGIEELDSLTRSSLRTVARKIAYRGEFMAVHIGYSTARKRVMGFVYESRRDFKSVEMTDGHVLSPTVNPDDPEYGVLSEVFTPAARGRDVEEFHQLVARNQYRSFASGRFREGVGIGGELITARVDSDGIKVRRAMVLTKARDALKGMAEPEGAAENANADRSENG